MSEVHNWQLNRKMQFPYEQAHPRRQVGFVFDINRCIGCQTCTMACRSTWTFSEGQEHMWWNNVSTQPYGGYPQGYDVQLLEKLGPQEWNGDTYEGQTIFENKDGSQREVPLGYQPDKNEWRIPNIYEDTSTGHSKEGESLPHHVNFFHYLQRICNHCTYPGCLAGCPRKSIYKRPEDGIVLVDQERCRGYQECVKGCPYKKAMFNSETNTAEKCIACYPRVEEGIIPRCMAACVGCIRLAGWVSRPEDARPDNPIDYLVHHRKVALPLFPQFGTEPNVYYVPPRWAPPAYLYQMFGPGAEDAVKTRTNPDDELFAVLKLFGCTQGIIERYEHAEGMVRGFDRDGTQIVEVPMEEPFYVRPFHEREHDAHRFNEP